MEINSYNIFSKQNEKMISVNKMRKWGRFKWHQTPIGFSMNKMMESLNWVNYTKFI
jgi:hypothetical protein